VEERRRRLEGEEAVKKEQEEVEAKQKEEMVSYAFSDDVDSCNVIITILILCVTSTLG
jgi:hypothetical protein